MKRKAKAIKKMEQEMPNKLLVEILTKLLVTEGAEVLQERHNFTEEQSVVWAIETMNRAQVRMSSEERAKLDE